MSDERLRDERLRDAQPRLADIREEAALPLRADHGAVNSADERQKGLNVMAFSLLLVIVASIAIEYGGWQIALDQPGAPSTGIDMAEFVRNALDTMLGAVGVGAAAGIATLLFPSTWKRPWRRIAVGFLGGAAGFLGFLSWLTLSYFL